MISMFGAEDISSIGVFGLTEAANQAMIRDASGKLLCRSNLYGKREA
jgi:hypothetical protein